MAEKIEILIRDEDLPETTKDLAAAGVEFESAISRGADGSHLISLLATLGPATIAGLTSYYLAKTRAQKFVKFRYKGIELEGVSDATIGRVLEQISKSGKSGDESV